MAACWRSDPGKEAPFFLTAFYNSACSVKGSKAPLGGIIAGGLRPAIHQRHKKENQRQRLTKSDFKALSYMLPRTLRKRSWKAAAAGIPGGSPCRQRADALPGSLQGAQETILEGSCCGDPRRISGPAPCRCFAWKLPRTLRKRSWKAAAAVDLRAGQRAGALPGSP